MMQYNLGGNNYSNAMSIVEPVGATYDATANNNDKSIVVSDNERWDIKHGFVTYTSSAVVGNRRLVFEVLVNGLVFGRVSAGAVQAASTTNYYQFLQGTYRETTFINDEIQVPLPVGIVTFGGVELRFYDINDIDSNDTMIVRVSYSRYPGLNPPTVS